MTEPGGWRHCRWCARPVRVKDTPEGLAFWRHYLDPLTRPGYRERCINSDVLVKAATGPELHNQRRAGYAAPMTDTATALHPVSAHRTITVPAFPTGTREIRELDADQSWVYSRGIRTGSMTSVRAAVAAIAGKLTRKVPGLTIHLFADDMGADEWCTSHREFGRRHPDEQAREGVRCTLVDSYRTDITVAATGVPTFDGEWSIAGSLSVDMNDVVTAKTFGPDEFAHQHTALAGSCAHCGVKRRRAVTVLLRNAAGDVRPVGRSCLGDYTTGSIRAEVVAELLALGERMATALGVVAAAEPDSAPTLDVVAVAILLERQFGFIRRGHGSRTQDDSATMLRKSVAPQPGESSPVQAHALTEADRAAAREAIAAVAAETPDGDYIANLQAIVAEEWVQITGMGAKLGLLASLPGAAQRAAERAIRAAERAARDAARLELPNAHIGTVKGKVEITGRVDTVREISGDYGTSTLIKVETPDGLVKMFTTATALVELEAGQTVTITGTVKSHDSYQDRRETLISRPKLVGIHATA